jgi:hypothetical protein
MDDDDRQFLRVKLVQLAHLLIDADVALGVRQHAELAAGNLLHQANPVLFLMQVQELLGLLTRPSRWRLELTQQEQRELDATFASAAKHLKEVSRGKAFDPAQVQLVFEALLGITTTGTLVIKKTIERKKKGKGSILKRTYDFAKLHWISISAVVLFVLSINTCLIVNMSKREVRDDFGELMQH